MTDADIIKKCYETLVQQAFDVYWNNAFIGNPPPSQVQQAEAKFKNQIIAARQARDRAMALLPP